MIRRYRYGLGISTLHLAGKHWVDIYRYDGRGGSIWFMSLEYGKDYSTAVLFVNELNQGQSTFPRGQVLVSASLSQVNRS